MPVFVFKQIKGFDYLVGSEDLRKKHIKQQKEDWPIRLYKASDKTP